MKSEYQIKFDWDNAKAQAARLEELAAWLSAEVVGAMDDNAQQLHAAWTGENATTYLRKQDELKEEINCTANTLRAIASDIKSIARQIYNAEMAALAIARDRSSSGGGFAGGGSGGGGGNSWGFGGYRHDDAGGGGSW